MERCCKTFSISYVKKKRKPRLTTPFSPSLSNIQQPDDYLAGASSSPFHQRACRSASNSVVSSPKNCWPKPLFQRSVSHRPSSTRKTAEPTATDYKMSSRGTSIGSSVHRMFHKVSCIFFFVSESMLINRLSLFPRITRAVY